MQPHDRAERQSRRHREDERGALVAPATDPHHCREKTQADRQPECPRGSATGDPGRARRCTACTSRHRPRPGAGASDPDSPRDRRSRSRPTRRRAAARRSPSRSRPSRSVAWLRTRRRAARGRTSPRASRRPPPSSRAHVPESPGDRGRETEHQGHVPGLDGVPDGRPEEDDAEAAPVAYTEHVGNRDGSGGEEQP